MSKRYKINTYGCQMNVHESEKIAAILNENGYEATDNQIADIVVFNTCCIRDTAERKILGHIGRYKKIKEQHPDIILVIVGCLSQQEGYDEIFKKRYPYVNIILGTRNISDLNEILKSYLLEHKKIKYSSQKMPVEYMYLDSKLEKYRTSFPNAWVNIIYGCNNFCTYCIVPHVRGREISRNKTDILDEVKKCLDLGYKEITLLGQNVNSYGNDLSTKETFASLLNTIDQLDYKFRLKFMTSHPKDLNDDVIDVMSDSKHIAHYLHLPIQSGSNKVLNDMHRRYTAEHYLNIIKKIRKKIPDIGLTTDIMVGFPSETDADFYDTYNIVKEIRYNSVFAFIYSPRKGTPAAEMEQIPYEIKQGRLDKILKLQNEITIEMSKNSLNEIHEILTDAFLISKMGYVTGKTFNGKIVNVPAENTGIGEFINIRITSNKNTSMFGEKI